MWPKGQKRFFIFNVLIEQFVYASLLIINIHTCVWQFVLILRSQDIHRGWYHTYGKVL